MHEFGQNPKNFDQEIPGISSKPNKIFKKFHLSWNFWKFHECKNFLLPPVFWPSRLIVDGQKTWDRRVGGFIGPNFPKGNLGQNSLGCR